MLLKGAVKPVQMLRTLMIQFKAVFDALTCKQVPKWDIK